jgi:hypothetical protein
MDTRLPDEVARLVGVAAERDRIVEHLAAMDPFESFEPNCKFCGSMVEPDHYDGCVWVRARDAVDRWPRFDRTKRGWSIRPSNPGCAVIIDGDVDDPCAGEPTVRAEFRFDSDGVTFIRLCAEHAEQARGFDRFKILAGTDSDGVDGDD